jgi:predicted nucleotidyltransferase
MNIGEMPQSVRLALEELKGALVELYGERLEGVYLYGSYARGDFTEDSDIDVLIVLKGHVDTYEELTRLSEVVSDICLRHDVLIATYPVPATWVAERNSPLFVNIRREGRLI